MIPLPQKPKIIIRKNNTGVFEIDGLYPGYGITLGNALRRVLLSSLQGAAVTGVKIKGVAHEFSTIPGVLEDVIDIILNIKQLRLKLHGDEPQRLTLKTKGEKEVTAKDILAPSQVEIVNKDFHIATLTGKNSELDMELYVEKGLGYVPVEARKKERLEMGMIAIDSIFTPIKKVNFDVEKMRVGERTDYNKLRLHIETDGIVSPEEALSAATNILIDQFKVLTGINAVKKVAKRSPAEKASSRKPKEKTKDFRKTSIDAMKISTRTLNAVISSGIKTAGGLAQKKREDLVAIEGLGETGVKEIEKALKKLGLGLKD